MASVLLPSPFPCDPTRRPALNRLGRFTDRSRCASAALEAGGQTTYSSGAGISNTCRALHSLLGIQSPAAAALHRSARSSPLKPRALGSNARVVKRPPPPPRGKSKRSREAFEMDEDMAYQLSGDDSANDDQENSMMALDDGPSTPKRQRRPAPLHIPFGLERRDFLELTPVPAAAEEQLVDDQEDDDDATPRAHPASPHSNGHTSLTPRPGRSQRRSLPRIYEDATDADATTEKWTDADDRALIDLVLDKLQLSRRQWDECARQLGADQRSLGARWKVLVDEGQVGLRLRRGGRKARGDVRGVWAN